MSAANRPARPIMPAWLERFDDRRGIVWRSYNALRGINLARSARFLRAYAAGPGYRRPVFIIGAPRSGTTLLFEMLSQHPALASLGHEGHDIWRRFHHPRKTGYDSDAFNAARANGPAERRYAEAFIRARAVTKPGARRFVEKTPDNALRTDYILKLFPDAHFVVIHRDPLAVVSSLIDGWRDPGGRFRSYFVPKKLSIPEYPFERQWCFTLIPGWRELSSSRIRHIAFRQWAEYAQALARAREALPQSRFTEIYLDDLRAEPANVLAELGRKLGLDLPEAILDAMAALAATRVNSFAAGATSGGWRTRNAARIESLLPEIAHVAPLIGFEIDQTNASTRRIAPHQQGV